MPQAKPRPSEIAAQAKRLWIPHIDKMPGFPSRSSLYPESTSIIAGGTARIDGRLRVAVIDGDPVDVALGWYQCEVDAKDLSPQNRIPVLNMANEKRPAGDWESGLMAPEECLARRSNLARALVTPWRSGDPPHHPIPPTGGIYSPCVGMFPIQGWKPADAHFGFQLFSAMVRNSMTCGKSSSRSRSFLFPQFVGRSWTKLAYSTHSNRKRNS
jgi:hypothetical protein